MCKSVWLPQIFKYIRCNYWSSWICLFKQTEHHCCITRFFKSVWHFCYSWQLLMTYWSVSTCIMASEVLCRACLNLIWVIGNNLFQSKTAVPLCQTVHYCLARVMLGPVHFLYINDMHRSSNQIRFVDFADDTTIFASDSVINNILAIMNRELVGVDNWIKTNRLYGLEQPNKFA